MSKNIITIDIDSKRERPILINKPKHEEPSDGESLDDIIKKDIRDILLTTIYMGSMLSEEEEIEMLEESNKMIKKRIDEINRNDKE